MTDSQLATKVRQLLERQRIGVLCTSIGDRPYGSPMGFLLEDSLRWIAFATGRSTKKFSILSANPIAAFVVDNRTIGSIDPNLAEAVIAAGTVVEPNDIAEKDVIRARLCQKYPEAAQFFSSESVAVLKLIVSEYTFVAGLEKGVELKPEL